MKIFLKDIATIDNPDQYKVHVASYSDEHPLDVFVRDREEWKRWNSWRSKRDDFNRQYIFSIIDFYHEPDIWLFGGIFEVLDRLEKKRSIGYKVQLTKQLAPFIGRLKLNWIRRGRTKARVLENCVEDFVVSEILREPYTGEAFCGYEHINQSFQALESIILRAKPDWKAALENVKGVYMITDTSNNKRYIGAAYGSSGVWSRWSCYVVTGHGYNDELTQLIKKKGLQYARANFRFCLLEYRPMKTDDQVIIDRESFWKEALISRDTFGYNKN